MDLVGRKIFACGGTFSFLVCLKGEKLLIVIKVEGRNDLTNRCSLLKG